MPTVTIDRLHAFRNTCSVSYWKEGWRRVAKSTGLPIEIVEKNNDAPARPMGSPGGSGPGGRVRMGDDMRPSDYSVMCEVDHAEALEAAHAAYVERLLAGR